MLGICTLAVAQSFPLLLLGGALLGIGSSIFHPEASRVARIAAGTSHGLAQSIFQVGGNFGSSLGPLLVVFIVLPGGMASFAWFSISAMVAMVILIGIGHWYANHRRVFAAAQAMSRNDLSPGRIATAIFVLTLLMLSKTFYLASFDSFYHFYLMVALSPQDAQLCLFVFLAAVAAGTLVGGPVGDHIGRKKVLWGSILGVLPVTMALPYVNLTATIALSLLIGFVMASAFSAIVVFAQSLVPHRIGMISGVFFGLLFGFGGLGAALVGFLADLTSIEYVYKLCAFLPVMGLLTAFLPEARQIS
jgi:FSR family fosmidomycin resistance protein-like MFS transporter